MNKMIEKLTTLAKWAGVALGISAVAGSIAALVFKWPIIQGIYVLCFIIAGFSMLYASVMFVGTPQMRYDYLVKGRMLRKHGRGDEVEPMEDQGVIPALIAVILVLIGFALEASMH